MEIVWKYIEGYGNTYQVNNIGQIRNRSKILKQSINQYGYYQVSLYKNGKKKTELVHRLVGITFIPNPDNKLTINHIDGNKLNNNLNNLEWATMKEQIHHCVKVLGHKRTISDKCRQEQIRLHQRRVRRSDGEIFESIKIASDGNESLRRRINDCCKGRRITAGGFGWEYVN